MLVTVAYLESLVVASPPSANDRRLIAPPPVAVAPTQMLVVVAQPPSLRSAPLDASAQEFLNRIPLPAIIRLKI